MNSAERPQHASAGYLHAQLEIVHSYDDNVTVHVLRQPYGRRGYGCAYVDVGAGRYVFEVKVDACVSRCVTMHDCTWDRLIIPDPEQCWNIGVGAGQTAFIGLLAGPSEHLDRIEALDGVVEVHELRVSYKLQPRFNSHQARQHSVTPGT